MTNRLQNWAQHPETSLLPWV